LRARKNDKNRLVPREKKTFFEKKTLEVPEGNPKGVNPKN